MAHIKEQHKERCDWLVVDRRCSAGKLTGSRVSRILQQRLDHLLLLFDLIVKILTVVMRQFLIQIVQTLECILKQFFEGQEKQP